MIWSKPVAGGEAKVAKFVGFKWRKSKSAERRSEETHLMRRGNAYLRYYLCEAASTARRMARRRRPRQRASRESDQ